MWGGFAPYCETVTASFSRVNINTLPTTPTRVHRATPCLNRLRESGRGWFRTHDLRRTAASATLDVVSAALDHDSDKDTKILVRHYLRNDLVKRKALALTA
jgi:integrase